MEERSGIENIHRMWDVQITIGIAGLCEHLVRDDGIEEPNRGPSFLGKGFVREL